MPAPKAPFLRFMESYTVNGQTGCWEWSRPAAPNGYGKIKVFGKMREAHRFAYELYKGPIVGGLHVMHQCDNKICVNPDHMDLGTHADNMRQAHERGLVKRGIAHARRGIDSSQAQPVLVKGRAFGSQKEAENTLGLGSGTVRYWLKTNSTKAKQISRKEYQQYAQ